MQRCASTVLTLVVFVALSARSLAAASPAITIELSRNTPREQRARATLERLLADYDLTKYVFTNRVVIEQGATNHAFPVLTLNPYFADSPDELLSTFLHEQLHWHLRERNSQQQSAVTELRRLYRQVPVGLPQSADTEYSTYAHLVDCYLEIVADREILGAERTAAVITSKPWYTWIYTTVLADEPRIAEIVTRHRLRVPDNRR